MEIGTVEQQGKQKPPDQFQNMEGMEERLKRLEILLRIVEFNGIEVKILEPSAAYKGGRLRSIERLKNKLELELTPAPTITLATILRGEGLAENNTDHDITFTTLDIVHFTLAQLPQNTRLEKETKEQITSLLASLIKREGLNQKKVNKKDILRCLASLLITEDSLAAIEAYKKQQETAQALISLTNLLLVSANNKNFELAKYCMSVANLELKSYF